MPLEGRFSWGLIRIVDRLKVSNEYLTFGGSFVADTVDDAVVSVFTSPAPLLRRGVTAGVGPAREWLGAFFGRLLIAVDYEPGFEALVAAAEPSRATPHSSPTALPATGRASRGAWTNLDMWALMWRRRSVDSARASRGVGRRVTYCWLRAAWLRDLWPVQSGPSRTLSPLRFRSS